MKLERLIVGCKNLVRTGWMQRGVPPSVGETVAGHSFEAGVIAYVVASKLREKGHNVNPDRAAVIALFHDVGESLIGDLPKWFTDRASKERIELSAIEELGVGKELFLEYERRDTLEGAVAKFSEMMATYKQALRYRRQGYSVDEIIETYNKKLEEMWRLEPFSSCRKEIEEILFNEDK
ncbi:MULTISPECIES: HD domain-containing protein [Metallosphaera]|uniref:5'-deoxynucleotidase n=3 Tax=Metallosphaera TaxID=41980 RepID=A4YEH0_METS5|nr:MULTISPECIES: HD family hydrolase [Metallosphaera]ABP94822.1 metal dependent phosphohydrolase [Metallosphaera sedula DSM 5348]AIM26809.1 metal dependent phosphohydrolase [Metallosphaera sedula]AKV73760.1 phosphohydrolase [Metallosphaera sedula]AKV76000.1 phosphohydrolase [Metallosphaera sedula]AKV78251.1 phosphohydrolase [Metallosphaera sedula]